MEWWKLKILLVLVLFSIVSSCGGQKKEEAEQEKKKEESNLESVEKFCLKDPINITNTFATSETYKQPLDNFFFAKQKSDKTRRTTDFFNLNETSGHRFFFRPELLTFQPGKLVVNIPGGKALKDLVEKLEPGSQFALGKPGSKAAAAIFYGLKFDKPAMSGLNVSRVLNKNINATHQGKAKKIYVKAKGDGEIDIKVKKNSVNLLTESIKINDRNEKRYEIALESIANRDINEIAVEFQPNSRIELSSIGLDISFGPKEKQNHLTDTALFLFSSILDGFDESKGMIFESARAHRDRMGYGVPSTGMFALALIIGVDLGFIDHERAKSLFEKVLRVGHPIMSSKSLKGWLPHFIHEDAKFHNEYSVIDTAIYYVSMLFGIEYFKLGEQAGDVFADMKKIDFGDLTQDGRIALGYDGQGKKIPYFYDVAGGEFILIEVLRQIVTQNNYANLKLVHFKTWNEIGFIPEIANLYFFQFGGLDAKDKIYDFNWHKERMRVFTQQKGVLADKSPYFGFSECEIATKDDQRRYIQQGADLESIRSIGENFDSGFWFTPSYVFMTSLLTREAFAENFARIKDFIAPLSSVPECMYFSYQEKKLVRYNFFQIPLRMYFSLISIYHFLKQGCETKNYIYQTGTDILKKHGVLQRFYGQAINGQPNK